jgi:CRP/FNR family transcriptional regulator, cyclic AMP receptor protein
MTDELTQLMGWCAAALVLTSFYLKTMIPLRMVAMVSNAVFIAYGLQVGATPIVVLHALLFPLNAVRLFQMRALTRKVRSSSRGRMSPSMLLPYMTQTRRSAGTEIFRRGDDSTEVYYIISGAVRILEFDKVIRPGDLLGEMGVFTDDYKRTGTAVCETDVELGSISADKFWETFFQDPTFGAYLIRTIVKRSTSNVDWAASTYESTLDSRMSAPQQSDSART